MVFVAFIDGNIIITDNYDSNEIKKELHIKNIKEDVKRMQIGHTVTVELFDSNFSKINEFTVD